MISYFQNINYNHQQIVFPLCKVIFPSFCADLCKTFLIWRYYYNMCTTSCVNRKKSKASRVEILELKFLNMSWRQDEIILLEFFELSLKRHILKALYHFYCNSYLHIMKRHIMHIFYIQKASVEFQKHVPHKCWTDFQKWRNQEIAKVKYQTRHV